MKLVSSQTFEHCQNDSYMTVHALEMHHYQILSYFNLSSVTFVHFCSVDVSWGGLTDP